MSRRTAFRSTVAGLVLAAVACLWIAFAPAQLGGRSSYALIAGSSMEPNLHQGDLAIVRGHDAYRVGDVILFDDRDLGRDVLHRVVAHDGARFVTKGDNNDYRDEFRPAAGDVRGALWLRLPAVGRPLGWLRVPWHAALLVALAALAALAIGSGGGAVTRGRRPAMPPVPAALPRETVLAGALAALGVLAFMALLAWTRPATTPVSVPAYAQQAHFSYRAPATRSAVYPDGSADTGEPVFLRLTHELDVAFAWSLETALEHDAGGTASLEAVLSDGHGLERRIPLVASRPFSGGRVRLAARLDLDRLRDIVERIGRLTGAGTTTWSLALQPVVRADASVAGRPLDLSFDTPLPFTLDAVRLQPEPGESGVDALVAPRIAGTLERPVAADLAFGIGVRTARLLSLLGLAAALAAAAWSRPAGRDRPRPGVHDLAVVRLGSLLVEATGPAQPQGAVVDLEELDGLIRIAEASGRLVLHARTPLGHEYAVEDGGTVYRFRTGLRADPEPVLRAAGSR